MPLTQLARARGHGTEIPLGDDDRPRRHPSTASIGIADVRSTCVPELIRHSSIAAGSKARTLRAVGDAVARQDGRGRVTRGCRRCRGLNESPRTAIGLAVQRADEHRARSFRPCPTSWSASLTSSTASMMLKVHPVARVAIWPSARESLGKQEPPNPGPGWRNFGPTRLVQPHAVGPPPRHRHRGSSAQLRDLVDERDLGRQEAVRGVLDQLGGLDDR